MQRQQLRGMQYGEGSLGSGTGETQHILTAFKEELVRIGLEVCSLIYPKSSR